MMKVAFASTNGKVVNRPFGSADRFFVWEIGRHRATCVARVDPKADADDLEAKTAARAGALAGCVLVCSSHMNGLDAAKLRARRIQPLKAATDARITELVRKLQWVLWMDHPVGLRIEEELG